MPKTETVIPPVIKLLSTRVTIVTLNNSEDKLKMFRNLVNVKSNEFIAWVVSFGNDVLLLPINAIDSCLR